MRSNETRRIRVARLASGAGRSPAEWSAARTNASTGLRAHAAAGPCKAGGTTRRIGRSDHQSLPPLRGDSGSAGYGAPASIQARTVAISSFERAPLGGISPSVTFSTRGLSAGRPGTIAAPLSPPAIADARRLRSSPPFFFSGPWQATHRLARIAPASRADPGAGAPSAGPGVVCAVP